MTNYTNEFQRALSVARGGDYLILDTETTGLTDAYVLQIAIIDPFGNVLLNAMIDPEVPIPADSTAIHGIKAQDVSYAVKWPTIAKIVDEIVADNDVFIYNRKFDLEVMQHHARVAKYRAGWMHDARFYCAMNMYAEYYGDWNDYHHSFRWQKLSEAASRFGVDTSMMHDALGDCQMTRSVLNGIVEALRPPEVDSPF